MSRYEANVAEMAASSNVFPVMYKGEVIEKYFVSKEGDFFGQQRKILILTRGSPSAVA